MKIIVDGENLPEQAMMDKIETAAKVCLEVEEVDGSKAEISLTFTDMEEIQQLNKEYRGIDSATDVLSFPQFEDKEQFPKQGDIVMGDVVICTDKAIVQAEEFGHSPEREIIYLFVHSLLHLMGYDHMSEEDKKIMRSKEETVMQRINLERTL